MDALNMSHQDGQFDLVWACESGEHMPDKEKYVQEMSRVLKPGELFLPSPSVSQIPPSSNNEGNTLSPH